MTSLTIERPANHAAGRPQGRAGPGLATRLGMRIWRLFTSVNFAVVQIVAVSVLAVFGMTIRQLPGFAFRSPGDYTIEVNAKGKKPWKQPLHIVATPGVDRLEVPALEDAPAEPKPVVPLSGPVTGSDYVPPQPSSGGSTQRTIGFVVGGVGIAAGVVAVILEVLAVKQQDKSQTFAREATDPALSPSDKSSKETSA